MSLLNFNANGMLSHDDALHMLATIFLFVGAIGGGYLISDFTENQLAFFHTLPGQFLVSLSIVVGIRGIQDKDFKWKRLLLIALLCVATIRVVRLLLL